MGGWRCGFGSGGRYFGLGVVVLGYRQARGRPGGGVFSTRARRALRLSFEF